MIWNTGRIKKLIDEYRKRPELWDVKHDMYRVYQAKAEAWQEVSAVLGCEVTEMRKKLNSLLASHRRERQRISRGGRTTWFVYDRLSFLPSHLENSNQDDKYHNEHTVSQDEDMIVNEEYLDPDDSSHDELSEAVHIKRESVSPPPVSPPPVIKVTKMKRSPVATIRSVRRRVQKKPPRPPRPLPSPPNETKLLDTLQSLRHSNVTVKKRDECDIFGEYIANSLKKHDDRTQAMIKHAINNIIFEQEMKKYSANQFHMITIDDENPLVLSEQLDES